MRFMAGESPITGLPRVRSAANRRFSRRSEWASMARSTTTDTSSISIGLVRYSYAPDRIARTASRSEPRAVSITTGIVSSRSRIACKSCRPSMSGIW